MARIVVGVDGSDESKTALRWAAEEARIREATLEVAYVYRSQDEGVGEVPVMARTGEEVRNVGDGNGGEEQRRQAKSVIERMLSELEDRSGLATAMSPIEGRNPARALVELAKGSDLLVVGSRGRGGFSGLVLGSVSQQCAHHATCPVTIVPTGDAVED